MDRRAKVIIMLVIIVLLALCVDAYARQVEERIEATQKVGEDLAVLLDQKKELIKALEKDIEKKKRVLDKQSAIMSTDEYKFYDKYKAFLEEQYGTNIHQDSDE
jgi:hypothetical protein